MRDQWKFRYTVREIEKAAGTKEAFHQSRLDWWKAKKLEILQKIKEEGIEVDESLADEYSKLGNSTSYNRGATVQIRNDLLKDLQECVSKITEHQGKVKGYNSWVQVLEAVYEKGAESNLELDQADWLYFYGK